MKDYKCAYYNDCGCHQDKENNNILNGFEHIKCSCDCHIPKIKMPICPYCKTEMVEKILSNSEEGFYDENNQYYAMNYWECDCVQLPNAEY